MIKQGCDALQSKSRRSKGKSSTLTRAGKVRRIKQPSKRTLKLNAWVAFSKYIRLRDCLKTTGTLTNGKCITCGKLLNIGFSDAGHFVSRRYNSVLFDEQNVHLQCRYCNRYLNGNLLEYRRQLIKLYGEGTDVALEDKATEIKKFSEIDLTNIKNCYILKAKELMKG